MAADAARTEDRGANAYAAGLFEVLMERLATNNALQAPDPASPVVLQEISRRRAAVEKGFVPGMAALSALSFPDHDTLQRELDAELARGGRHAPPGR